MLVAAVPTPAGTIEHPGTALVPRRRGNGARHASSVPGLVRTEAPDVHHRPDAPTPRRLRRPSYATVASSIALGVALCTGSAVAAATIGSAQIKPNAVLSRHIDDGAVRSRDIHRGAVTAGKVGHDAIGGANVAADALEGDDIDESTLGPVPVAASLSGVPVTALMGATVTKVESALQPGTLLGDGTYVISQDCPGGSTLLAGGPANARSTSILLESFPSPGTTNGWTARINKQGVDDDFSVVLLCASRSA